MKKINIFYKTIAICFVILSFTSCKVTTNTKDISYMEIKFRPLERKDMTLVGNLSAESVTTGVASKGGKKLDSKYIKNAKQGLITSKSAKEIMYFAPKEGTSITGNLYENVLFNSVSGSAAPTLMPRFFSNFLAKFKQASQQSDPGMSLAYYKLIEKYPKVDYFINVRFERETTLKGSKFTETIKASHSKLR